MLHTVRSALSAGVKSVYAPKATFVRGFAAPASKDVVKELYLKELRAFTPSKTPVSGAEVKDLQVPAAPQAPTVAQDFSKDLAAYDVSVGQATTSSQGLLADATHSTFLLDVMYEDHISEWEEHVARLGPVTKGQANFGYKLMTPPQFIDDSH